MKKQKMKFIMLFALFILVSNTSVYAENAQDPVFVTEEGPDVPPAAPISDALPLVVLLGIGLALSVHQKQFSNKI